MTLFPILLGSRRLFLAPVTGGVVFCYKGMVSYLVKVPIYPVTDPQLIAGRLTFLLYCNAITECNHFDNLFGVDNIYTCIYIVFLHM